MGVTGLQVGGGLAGGLVAAGIGSYVVFNAINDREAEGQERVDSALTQFDSWKAKLDSAFPDRKLPTPEEHARFEDFLRDNPAPYFVDVEHEDHTKIHAGYYGGGIAGAENGMTFGIGTLLGGVVGIAGGVALLESSKSWLGRGAGIAAIGLGVGSIAGTFTGMTGVSSQDVAEHVEKAL